MPPSGLDPGPGIGRAGEMLGIVNLNRIDIRNPADGVPERKLEELLLKSFGK